MKIFLDFDDVVFCTKRFVADFMQVFAQNGIDDDLNRESVAQMKKRCGLKTGYNMEAHLDVIAQYERFDMEVLRRDLDKFLLTAQNYVHDDVAEFVGTIRKLDSKAKIFLISYGVIPFQERKIVNSGILKLVDGHSVGCFDKGAEVEKYLSKSDDAWFIDDRAEFVQQVKVKLPNVKTALMLRPDGRYDDEPTKECDFVVSDLREFAQIIRKSQSMVK